MRLLCYSCSTLMGKIKTGRKKKNNNNKKGRGVEGGATAECEGGECQSGRVAMVVPEAAEGVLAALRAPEPSTPCAPKT